MAGSEETMNLAGNTALVAARRGIAVMFFSGMLMALLGGVLLVWRQHLEPDYVWIGHYFLVQNLGVLGGGALGERILGGKGIGFVLALGCGQACAALLILAAFSPPSSDWGRLAGLLLLGGAAGLINHGGMHAITPMYERHRTATLNLAGILFGAGCLTCVLFLPSLALPRIHGRSRTRQAGAGRAPTGRDVQPGDGGSLTQRDLLTEVRGNTAARPTP